MSQYIFLTLPVGQLVVVEMLTDRGGDVVSDLSRPFPPGHSRCWSRPNNLAESLVSPASRHGLRSVQQGDAQWAD